MKVYYNEFDKKKCAALKQLMAEGYISKGEIDDRSIRDVQPSDLKEYERYHFFAGIGLWDYALNIARWPEGLRVWTGSCPCQPFSAAGRQKGKTDDRHLWPEWLRLIKECSPTVIFGEQVANAVTKGWLDDVYQGLEAENYAIGSIVLPACSVGAPHKRDRLWFVGDTKHDGQTSTTLTGSNEEINGKCAKKQNCSIKSAGTSAAGIIPSTTMADTQGWRGRRNENIGETERLEESDIPQSEMCGGNGTVVQPKCKRLEGYTRNEESDDQQRWLETKSNGSAWEAGFWIDCPDEKQRLVEPSICLLADGHTERMALLHSAGDAIVPDVAAEFIEAYLSIHFSTNESIPH